MIVPFNVDKIEHDVEEGYVRNMHTQIEVPYRIELSSDPLNNKVDIKNYYKMYASNFRLESTNEWKIRKSPPIDRVYHIDTIGTNSKVRIDPEKLISHQSKQ